MILPEFVNIFSGTSFSIGLRMYLPISLLLPTYLPIFIPSPNLSVARLQKFNTDSYIKPFTNTNPFFIVKHAHKHNTFSKEENLVEGPYSKHKFYSSKRKKKLKIWIQIMQKLFGYQSEEEKANSNDEEKANSNDELHDQFVSDGELEPECEGQTKYKGEEEPNRSVPKAVHHDHLGSSRSLGNEKGKDPASVIHDVFGGSDDDEELEDVVRTQITEKKRSPKYKGRYVEESPERNVIPDEDETYEHEEECTKPELKGKEVEPMEVFEIPFRAPPARPNKMATLRLSNLIGIDPKPFDPATYVDEDYYVTDSSGTKRLVPHINIIRFREVKNPDGTTSVESNARFVEWSDGSLQLLIGSEAFDVSEQDAQDIQSHLFLRHGQGIYQSQGRISRKLKFMPSSLSSNSHRMLTALVDSRHKKVNKVQQYISDKDPERELEQKGKAEKQILKASKQLHEKKKKVINMYLPKGRGRNERELTPGFLEDSSDEDQKNNYESPSASAVWHFNEDSKTEAAAEKRIMNAKMKSKDTSKSAISSAGLTMGALHISKQDKVVVDDDFEGNEVASPISSNEMEDMSEDEEEELFEDFEGPKGKSESSKSKSKQQFIKDTPAWTGSRRRNAIIYDSSDE